MVLLAPPGEAGALVFSARKLAPLVGAVLSVPARASLRIPLRIENPNRASTSAQIVAQAPPGWKVGCA